MNTVLRLRCTLRMGSVAGSREGDILYQTFVNCDDAGEPFQCSSTKCTNRVLRDCYYCERHLQSNFGVVVAESHVDGGGLGLFTTRDFSRGSVIVHYGGETITPDEVHNRYGWMQNDQNDYIQVVAPYAMGINDSENTVDAIRIRGAASYINDARDTPFSPNVFLSHTHAVAKCNIAAGSELFASYGDSYWSCAFPYIMHHTTTLETVTIQEASCARKQRRIQ